MFFSCRDCKHSIGYPDGNVSPIICQHSAVKKLEFNVTSYLDLTEDDIMKLKHLIDNVLKLKVAFVPGVDVRFEFPFQYDPIWIIGCEGYEEK